AAELAVGADAIASMVGRVSALGPDPLFERRTVLVRAATGVAAVTLVPLITSAAAAAQGAKRAVRPKRLKIDGAWLCDQRYALCTFAACKPSKSNKNAPGCRC